jgi:hypothetical protein
MANAAAGMGKSPDAGRCLNCGADMHGAFCAACGQRSVPADPTVAELAGDAWHELTGYDGRIAATFRGLLHPGRLTLEYLAGHRARYLSPVRVYLTLSVIYFLIAAAAPVDPSSRPGQLQGPGQLRLGVWTTDETQMTAEERATLQKELDEMVWPLRVLVQSIQKDPEAFRRRLFTIMPRVFFGMLPVFAAIVWMFYRRRRFPAALVFATHVHAFAFLAFTFSEAAKFTQSRVTAAVVGVSLMVGFAVYILRSFKVVFGESWPRTVAKSAGVAFFYAMAAVPAYVIILVWAALP